MDRIGFIGLGKMGGPMARNLLAAGYKLLVCDVDRSRVTPLVEAGAEEAGSPKDVAAQTDLLITMLPSSPQVEEVLCGANGILAGAKKGCTVVDMSTGDPVVTRRLAKIAAQSGVELLDAPVTGGTKGAAAGTLTIMAGGRKEKVEELRPVFEGMGKRIVYAGDIGMGLAVKLCNQLVMSVILVAVQEAWLFGTRLGVNPQTIYEVVTHGTGGCWVLDNYVEHLGILPEPDKARMTEVGNNAIMIKDLGLVMSAAKELALPLPTAGAAHQIFLAMRANGLGDGDLWALGTVLRRLSGEKHQYNKEE
jgi:3-hydroxyisobutyrate dehydrogenase